MDAEGGPRALPDMSLPRGAKFTFLPTGPLGSPTTLLVLKGELQRKNFWVVDLETGRERQLTDFGTEFLVGDFDVPSDGGELIFERIGQESDVLLIERRAQ